MGLVLDINECEETEVLQQQRLHTCEWKCMNLPGTYRCICPRGYRLDPNGHHCEGQHTNRHTLPAQTDACIYTQLVIRWDEFLLLRVLSFWYLPDVNECELKNGSCSHLCINHRGGFKCACPETHRISPYNRKNCQPVDTNTSSSHWRGLISFIFLVLYIVFNNRVYLIQSVLYLCTHMYE